MELKDTVELMLSSDYRDRFRAEYYQIKIRYEKLSNLLLKHEKGELDFTLSSKLEIYQNQLLAMKNYMLLLEHRADDENISLD